MVHSRFTNLDAVPMLEKGKMVSKADDACDLMETRHPYRTLGPKQPAITHIRFPDISFQSCSHCLTSIL